MNKDEIRSNVPTKDIIRRSATVTIVCDVCLIVALALCLLVYNSQNNVSTYNQNIENILNITRSESELIQVTLDNMKNEVARAYSFCNGLTVTDALDYLNIISIDSESEYQLVKYDIDVSTDMFYVYNGLSTKKSDNEYIAVQYANTSLSESLHKHVGDESGAVSFSQSFTNKTDALSCFAVFSRIRLVEDDIEDTYYILKLQKESQILDQLLKYSKYSQHSQYSDMSLAISYTDGKYLASDSNFRASNFYEYLYRYNDLSLDERNAVRTSVQNDEDGSGVLVYNDYKGRSCAFVYSDFLASENWLVILAVPLSEFVSGKLLSFFPMVIIIFLLVLLAFNIWRLLVIVKELRLSVEREQIANSAKSSFLSRMSHEIRTPLNAIIGYNNMARTGISEIKDDQKQAHTDFKTIDCLRKSEIASKHLLSIINDVLDMSAIESGKIKIAHERFNVRELVTSLNTIFCSQAQAKGVKFKVIISEFTEDWLVGDQMRVNQILTNLLSNAIKFTPEDGSVTLTAVQSEAETDATHIHFTVADTGIGMTQEYINRIWMPFEQADSTISRRFGGTGLGLSITKNLVDLMGGSISVSSVQNQGSTFEVDLIFERTEQVSNSSDDADSLNMPTDNDGNAINFEGVHVLLAEDNQMNMEIAMAILTSAGLVVDHVWNGKEAVELFEASEPGTYSVILMDVHMPEMNGHMAASTIRASEHPEAKTIPIIAMTADVFAEDIAEAHAAGMNGHIGKPIDIKALFSILGRYIKS